MAYANDYILQFTAILTEANIADLTVPADQFSQSILGSEVPLDSFENSNVTISLIPTGVEPGIKQNFQLSLNGIIQRYGVDYIIDLGANALFLAEAPDNYLEPGMVLTLSIAA